MADGVGVPEQFSSSQQAQIGALKAKAETGQISGSADGQKDHWGWLKNLRDKITRRNPQLTQSKNEYQEGSQRKLEAISKEPPEDQLGPAFSDEESYKIGFIKHQVKNNQLGGTKDTSKEPLQGEAAIELGPRFSPAEVGRLEELRKRTQSGQLGGEEDVSLVPFEAKGVGEMGDENWGSLPPEKKEEVMKEIRGHPVRIFDRDPVAGDRRFSTFKSGSTSEIFYRELQRQYPELKVVFKPDEPDNPNSDMEVWFMNFNRADEAANSKIAKALQDPRINILLLRYDPMGAVDPNLVHQVRELEENGRLPVFTYERSLARSYQDRLNDLVKVQASIDEKYRDTREINYFKQKLEELSDKGITPFTNSEAEVLLRPIVAEILNKTEPEFGEGKYFFKR